MARSDWIEPCRDAGCRKIFLADRRTAEQHRIALEVWMKATGQTREGVRLTSYRCRRCGGFHLRHQKVANPPPSEIPPNLDDADETAAETRNTTTHQYHGGLNAY